MALNITQIKKEWLFFLRNSDIFTTTQREVTTSSVTGAFAADTSIIISVPNVKNVRSVIVGAVTLNYGSAYTVDVDYDNAGTKSCKITFTAAQTGDYTISYDYGTDKIHPDFPRNDLDINSFPRIGFDIIEIPSSLLDLDGTYLNTPQLTTIVYALKTEDLDDYISTLRALIRANAKNFYYIGLFVRVKSDGPILVSPSETGKQKIMQKNIDIEGLLNIER